MSQQTLSPTRNRAPDRVAYALAFALWQWAYMPPVLRENAFIRRFLATQFISCAGSWLQWASISVLVYETTGSAGNLAVTLLLSRLPGGIVSLTLGGRLADRYSVRILLLGSQITLMTQAGILCGLHMTGSLGLVSLYVLQAASSAIDGISGPAQTKLTVELAGKQQIEDALSINAVSMNIAWIGSSSLAGLIIGLGGVTWLFLANAISYFPIIVFLLRLKHAPLPERAEAPGLLPENVTLAPRRIRWRQLHAIHGGQRPENVTLAPRRIRWQGIKYIVHTPTVWLLLLIATVQSLFYMNGGLVQPLIGMSFGGVHGYAMISTSNGFGCLLGAFILLRLKQQKTIRGLLIQIFLMGTLLTAFALAPVLWLAMALMALGTILAEIIRTSANVLIQSNVPLELQGRVSGTKQGISQVCIVISNLSTGFVLVPAFGAHYASAGPSATGLVGIAACWVIFHRLHRAGKLETVDFKEVGFE